MKYFLNVLTVTMLVAIIGCNTIKSSKHAAESIGIKVDVHRAPSSVWSIATAA